MTIRSKRDFTKRRLFDPIAQIISSRNKQFIFADEYETPSGVGSGNQPDMVIFGGNASGATGGRVEVWLGGGFKFSFDQAILHLDEVSAAASTFYGPGSARLGKSDARWGMAWFKGSQTVYDNVSPTTWAGASAFGFETIDSRTVVGANQTVTPQGQVVKLSAAAAASVDKIDAPPGDFPTILYLHFVDSNVTMNDSGTAGAATTMNLVGNYVSTADGTLVLMWNNSPGSGNKRWIELSRSNP